MGLGSMPRFLEQVEKFPQPRVALEPVASRVPQRPFQIFGHGNT